MELIASDRRSAIGLFFMRIYINEHPYDVPDGADARSAVLAALPDLPLTDGGAYLTDGRGIALTGGEQLSPGSIVRVIVPARRGGADADA